MKNQVIFCCILFSIFLSISGNAQSKTEKRKKKFNLKGTLAIQGYDPVAYFTVKKAVKGSKQYQSTYQGVKYYFSSQKNQEKFKANPSKYEPAYGGWCSYAMAKNGQRVAINPGTFKIKEGKLHLFYNFYFTNTLTSWNKNEELYLKKGKINWAKYYHK